MKFYVGPYRAVQDAGDVCWTPPGQQAIDLRTLPEQAIIGSDGQLAGKCLIATPDTLDSDYELLGEAVDMDGVVLSDRQRKLLRSGRAVPRGRTLADAVASLLTTQSDPDGGDAGCPTALPRRDGRLNLHCGTTVTKHVRTVEYEQRLQHLLQRNHSRLADDPEMQKGDTDRKALWAWSQKYTKDWRDIVADRHRDRPPLPPTTTLSDDFNRADESLDAGNWTELVGNWVVESNMARCQNSVATQYARYDTPVSVDDMTCDVTWAGYDVASLIAGAIARKDNSSTLTMYNAAAYVNTDAYRLRKVVAGSITELAASVEANAPPVTMSLDVNGSDLEMFADSVSKGTATDTAISGNLYAGMIARKWAQLDGWGVVDTAGAGAGVTYTQLERHVRGLSRGNWTGGI